MLVAKPVHVRSTHAEIPGAITIYSPDSSVSWPLATDQRLALKVFGRGPVNFMRPTGDSELKTLFCESLRKGACMTRASEG